MDTAHLEALLGTEASCWVNPCTCLWPRQVLSTETVNVCMLRQTCTWCTCAAGHELLMLAKSFPDDRQIIGIDLAEGMVNLANARCAEAGIRLACPYNQSCKQLPCRYGGLACAVEEPEL